MLVSINGERQELVNENSLMDIINSKGINKDNVVIEHNLEIIPSEKWEEIFLKEGDKVEIISFVGGGK